MSDQARAVLTGLSGWRAFAYVGEERVAFSNFGNLGELWIFDGREGAYYVDQKWRRISFWAVDDVAKRWKEIDVPDWFEGHPGR